jgi:hypothetical protein
MYPNHHCRQDRLLPFLQISRSGTNMEKKRNRLQAQHRLPESTASEKISSDPEVEGELNLVRESEIRDVEWQALFFWLRGSSYLSVYFSFRYRDLR